MRPGGSPGRSAALGWLLLAACAGGRAASSGSDLPTWARADRFPGSHAEPEVVRGVHRVEKGETLYRIARSYGLTPEELAECNGLEASAALPVGTDLLLPAPLGPVRAASSVQVEAKDEAAARAWETPVEPRAGQPLPPELLRAFDEATLPEELARGFDRPLAPPPPRPPPAKPQPPAPGPPADARAAPVTASIGPPPPPEPRSEPGRSARSAALPRPAVASAAGAPLQWPLRGVLYARYGKKGREPHDGIDLAAPAGSPVRTAGEGMVLFAGPQAGYGLIVVVQHARGLVTVYAHARDVRVRTGQAVRPGQVIATVGESGKTSGPHLHFEVRVEGEPADPLRFLGPVPGP